MFQLHIRKNFSMTPRPKFRGHWAHHKPVGLCRDSPGKGGRYSLIHDWRYQPVTGKWFHPQNDSKNKRKREFHCTSNCYDCLIYEIEPGMGWILLQHCGFQPIRIDFPHFSGYIYIYLVVLMGPFRRSGGYPGGYKWWFSFTYRTGPCSVPFRAETVVLTLQLRPKASHFGISTHSASWLSAI